MSGAWKEKLHELLKKTYKSKSTDFIKKYLHVFSAGYQDDNSVQEALNDITYVEQLSSQQPLLLYLYETADKEFPLRLRVFQLGKAIPLADILPMLEHFDLRVDSERPYYLPLNSESVWISDFKIIYLKSSFDIQTAKKLFEDAFIQVYEGRAESDGFNKLILGVGLSWQEIIILRAYAKYLRQIHFRFSQSYIEKTLAQYPFITKELISFFMKKFNLKSNAHRAKDMETIEKTILQALDQVTRLDEDQIIRRLLDVMKATVRTNYFQETKTKEPKPYLSLKLQSSAIPELPLPLPKYEIFVYSPRFEAIHLRYDMVSRGGIRWSDRLEDFRTEILGLMKAQKVKNAIIVPSGAKGGFVLKTESQEKLHTEVVQCYQQFICGLLDLTDNIKNKKIIHPKNTICHDGDDTYLVVAADKGTASFSDIANQLSKAYDFWLADAFASGGSTGYDHKKMGITARGAWESIKRHFREINIDIHKKDITVIGIGDMSGDVFGNGMLYTKHIKLIAAFDHRHIFLDPDPDPLLSYNERERLFKLQRSSWEDYNPALISKGGGVYKRSEKFIKLSAQIKKTLDIKEDTLTPYALIRAILKAPVDLLYNGGIGTYVKARVETDEVVGDRTNDLCRVNGEELRCKVVGEGGNLGFTQLGRIEYALKDGLINTDFIDNSGGVDCSDHEVNLKILLNQVVQQGQLSEKNRNQLLKSVTDEVATLVLLDNHLQAWVMSFSAEHAKKNINLHANYIKELETLGIINRQLEYLPSDKILAERKSMGLGLTRPELAILLAYTKIYIKHDILHSSLPEHPDLNNIIQNAFPPSIRKPYSKQMKTHTLHRELIATQLSNRIVNEMGITFAYRLQTETGATIEEIMLAYTIASNIFGTQELRDVVESLDFQISIKEQYDILYYIRHLINLATRWFLHSPHLKENMNDVIAHYSKGIKALQQYIPQLMTGYVKEYLESLVTQFLNAGIPQDIATRVAIYRGIYTLLNVIDVATNNHFDLLTTAKIYFAAGERAHLVWFRDQIANDSREGHWNTLARLTLRDELDLSQRTLTIAIMNHNKKESDPDKLMDSWTKANERLLKRWDNILSLVHASTNIDYTVFFIAIKELLGLLLLRESKNLK